MASSSRPLSHVPAHGVPDAGGPADASGPAVPPARRRGRWALPGLLAALVALVAAALPMAARMRRPVPPPDVGTVKPTAHGVYRVLLAPEHAPAPLRRLHRWTVRVEPGAGALGVAARKADLLGAGTLGAGPPVTVTVDGGMPQHGHGLPTAPRVTGRLPDGRYVVDGVKFSMPGWWELRLRVAGPAGTDSVTFNVTL